MIAVTDLLVPQGDLTVIDHWQPLVSEGIVAAWHLTLREPYLNGEPIAWGPGTRDMLRSAADAIDGEPGADPLREHLPPGYHGTGYYEATR